MPARSSWAQLVLQYHCNHIGTGPPAPILWVPTPSLLRKWQLLATCTVHPLSMGLLNWFYDVLVLSMSLANRSQAAAFGGGGGLVPAGPWCGAAGAQQITSPPVAAAKSRGLKKGCFPPCETRSSHASRNFPLDTWP